MLWGFELEGDECLEPLDGSAPGGRCEGDGPRRAEDLVAKLVFYFMDLMPTQAQPESVPEAFCSRDIPEENQPSPERCALIERP